MWLLLILAHTLQQLLHQSAGSALINGAAAASQHSKADSIKPSSQQPAFVPLHLLLALFVHALAP